MAVAIPVSVATSASTAATAGRITGTGSGKRGGLGVGREGGDRQWVGGEVGCDVLEGGREGGCGLEVGSG